MNKYYLFCSYIWIELINYKIFAEVEESPWRENVGHNEHEHHSRQHLLQFQSNRLDDVPESLGQVDDGNELHRVQKSILSPNNTPYRKHNVPDETHNLIPFYHCIHKNTEGIPAVEFLLLMIE